MARQHRARGVTLGLTTTLVRQCCARQDTTLTVLGGSYDLSPRWGVSAAVGSVNDARRVAGSTFALANPTFGVTFGPPAGARWRLGMAAGVTLPFGQGGGDLAPRRVLGAMLAGTDWGGPMYAPNHLDAYVGARLAHSAGPFTLRLRSTLHHARRLRGQARDVLGHTVIFTSSGLLAELPLGSRASVFAEAAQTRYHNDPPFVASDRAAADDYYLIAGASVRVDLGGARALRPTLLYAHAVDEPKTQRRFRVLELDLRVTF